MAAPRIGGRITPAQLATNIAYAKSKRGDSFSPTDDFERDYWKPHRSVFSVETAYRLGTFFADVSYVEMESE